MAIKKEVREALKQKFSDVTQRRIDQIITETGKKYGVLNHDIAGYLLAHEKGIRLAKYLDKPIIEKVEQSIQKGPKIIVEHGKKRTEQKSQQITINIGREFSINHPILSRKLVTEAQDMAKVYPTIYVFENSVRNVVQVVLEKKHGTNWWDTKVSTKIRKKVSDRMNDEEVHKWHGKRGAHQIFYSDIEDLSDIISTNWNDFKQYFPNQAWVKTMIEIIGKSRNVVAHNNPLKKEDVDSVKVHFRNWTNQLKDFKI